MPSTIITSNWNLKSIDIKTAFLKGDFLKQDVYLKSPPEPHCDNNQIWKLTKCVYGLTDDSLMWFKRVKKFVNENNGMSSITDPALSMWYHNDKLFGVMTVHVDDFLCTGADLFYELSYWNLEKHFLLVEKKIVISNILVWTFNQRNFTLQLIKIIRLNN